MEFSPKEFKESSIYFFSHQLASVMEGEQQIFPTRVTLSSYIISWESQFSKVLTTMVGRRGRRFGFDI